MLSSESLLSGSSMETLDGFSRVGGARGGGVSLDLRRWEQRKKWSGSEGSTMVAT